jgi:hypothetical protein
MFSGVFLDDITAMKKQIETSTSGKKASSKSKKGEAKD